MKKSWRTCAQWILWAGWVTCAVAQEGGVPDVADAFMDDSGFLDVVAKGGAIGILLWLALAALSVAGTHLIVDSFIKIRAQRIVPEALTSDLQEALTARDMARALERCQREEGPLSNILRAGFIRFDEGVETAQEAIGAAADLESEKMMQRVNYLNVVGNLAPMLGLLGTVQGMIMAFATLGTEAGAAKNAMLATNISQALYTTAAGLVIAVPALGFFSFFRNRAAKIILAIEALTMDLMRMASRPMPHDAATGTGDVAATP